MADEADGGNVGLTNNASNDDGSQNNGDDKGGGGGNEATTFTAPFQLYNDDGAIADNIATVKNEATRNFFSKYTSEQALDDAIKNVGFLSRSKGFEPLPGDATDADKAKHQEHLTHLLGIPENVDGYGIKKPEGMEDAAWEKMNVNEYLEVALKNNVTPAAMNALMELDRARGAANAEEAKTAYDTAQAEQNDLMIQEFGGKTEAMYAKANEVAALLGFPKAEINSASLVKALNKASEYIKESTLMNVNQSLSNDAAGTYKKQADAIYADPSNQFYNDGRSSDPQANKRAHNEHTRLMKLNHEQTKGRIA